MKCCFKCQRLLPLMEYYRHPQMADGHLNKCKECTRKDSHKRQVDKREEIAAYDRQRFRDPARKAKIILYQRRMRR